MLTLGQAKQVLAQYCGTGKIPDDPTVPFDLNMAIERLMNKPHLSPLFEKNLILCAPNGQITMPREVLRILKSRMNGHFTHVFSQWYEYMETGPGLLENSKGKFLDLVDRGFVCTQYDIPVGHPMYLAVLSDRDEDPDAKLLIRGHDETGREVHGETTWGELLPIKGGTQDALWISESLFSDIMFVQKPVTNGYVYLSAILPDQGIRYFLGSFHPDETEPRYRRYFAHEVACCKDKESCSPIGAGPCHNRVPRLDALCRMQYVPATHDSDVLLVQNQGALKMMLKAQRLEDAEEIDNAQKYEASSERLMLEQSNTEQTQDDMVEIQRTAFGLGDVPSFVG